MGKVWDVTPPEKVNYDTKPVIERQVKEIADIFLKTICNQCLITELHNRGVSIEDIFGQYYAEEEMAAARDDEIFGNDEEGQHGDPNRFAPLTVGEARLVTPEPQPKVPLGEIPF